MDRKMENPKADKIEEYSKKKYKVNEINLGMNDEAREIWAKLEDEK